MNRLRLILLVCFILVVMQPGAVRAAEKTLNLGILALRPKPQMAVAWQPLADYLGSKLPGLSGSLATMIPREGPLPLTSFGGVIFSRSDRTDITQLSSLKDKKIACVAAGAGTFGGFQMQALELHRAGIHPQKKQLITTGMPQDLVIQTVLEGKADIGFVRTGLIEELERQARIPVGSLKVINRQQLFHRLVIGRDREGMDTGSLERS